MQNANKLGFWVEVDVDGNSGSRVYYVATFKEALDLYNKFADSDCIDYGFGVTEYATVEQRKEHTTFVTKRAEDILGFTL